MYEHMLLKSAAVYFIPVVNVDGYKLISDDWQNHNAVSYIRKNVANYQFRERDCTIGKRGVDLNRNYPVLYDTGGNSEKACHNDFRGPEPFSEPETRAVRDFLVKYDNVKIALNFHSYGNFMCMPFNGDPDKMNERLNAE